MTQAPVTYRRIFKSAVTSRKVIQELITLMMVGELVSPGDEVWMVSPWITDVPLLDNRAGSFDAVNPEWGHREIRLTDIAVQLMAGGTDVRIVTRPDDHNRVFLRRLTEAAEAAAVDNLLKVTIRQSLHTKGILTSRGFLSGSMNLTYSGLDLNDELITYETADQALAVARLAFEGLADPNDVDAR
jgi:phosphatidylserine/phosphatidylglycerophosphate/cardiolipin synthase-like enzyme